MITMAKLHIKKDKVDEKFHDNLKSLMKNFQLNGKIILAAEYATLEESRRLKIARLVFT